MRIRNLFKEKISNQSINSSNLWQGDYKNWNDANLNSSGYDSNLILEKCKNSLLLVKNGDAVYERDSVIFSVKEYSWGLLSGLLKLSIENNNILNIIDFGGSLGSVFFQNIDFLKPLSKVKWSIVEQKSFVECGKEYFESDILKFYSSIESCFEENSPNAIILSSVLQYLENPHLFLSTLFKYNFQYIFIDRTAFVDSHDDFLTVQNVPDNIYKASYPAWFFNKNKFLKHFENSQEIIFFDSGFTPPTIVNNKKVYWSGMIIKL